MFGAGGGTSSYREIEETNCILLWGSNARETHPIFFHHLLKGVRNGAKLYAIDPRLDVAGRSLLVRALVPNKEQRLRPGLFARVTVLLQLKEDALSVPEQAIVPQGDSQYVFKIVNGKVMLTKVVTGTRREGRVEIVDGLSAGDEVVTAGQLKIRDGSAVSIVNGVGA